MFLEEQLLDFGSSFAFAFTDHEFKDLLGFHYGTNNQPRELRATLDCRVCAKFDDPMTRLREHGHGIYGNGIRRRS